MVRTVRPAGPAVDARIKIDWGETDAAVIEIVVPESIGEYITAGGPVVMSGIPDPAWAASHPVSGPPPIAIFAVDPDARHENGIGVGLRRQRLFNRVRRRGKKFNR